MPNPPPKFSSFRPKAKSLTSRETGGHHSTSEDHPRAKQPRRSTSKSAENFRHHCSSAHDRDTQREEGSRGRNTSPLENHAFEHLFVVDRRGDPENRVYGTNARTQVPEYRVPPEKRLLGDAFAKRPQYPSERSLLSTLSRSSRLDLEKEEQDLVTGHQPFVELGHVAVDEFLPLNIDRKRKRSLLPGNGPKTDNSSLLDVSETELSGSESSDNQAGAATERIDLNLKKQNARFLSCVEAEPDNIRAWLDLIEFQETWVREGLGGDHAILRGGLASSVAEVRISLYEKALERSRNGGRDRHLLLLGLLKEGTKTWTAEKLSTKWRDTASSNKDCAHVQLEFLNYIQTNSSSFLYEKCRDHYAEYLKVLSQDSQLPAHGRILHQIYAILRLTSFMRDAGFLEMANSLWQSLLEISCLTPSWARSSHDEIVKSFEIYWDNEYPRVGEKDSLGWYSSHEILPPPQESKATEPSLSDVDSYSGPARVWLAKEQDSEADSLWACKATSDSDLEGDPYRVVFFSDLKPFLIEILPENRRLLIDAFLCYHRLPGLPGSGSCESRQWWQDCFLNSEQSREDISFSPNHSTGMIPTSETLFDAITQAFVSDVTSKSYRIDRSNKDFVVNVLYALTKAMPGDTDLVEYYVVFDSAINPTRAKKVAKAMLKQTPSNLTLYNAYGLLEYRLGKSEVANHVFPTAIQLAKSLGASQQLKVIVLQRSWIWQAVETNDVSLALERFKTIGPTIDAVETGLRYSRDKAMQTALQKIGATASELLALQQYVMSSSAIVNLQAALETFSKESVILSSFGSDATLAVELLHQAQAQLIRHHMTRNKSYSPNIVRDALRPAIKSFPDNTIFFSLYAENERRFRIDDRVRDITRDILLADRETVNAWIFALQTEMERNSGNLAFTTVHAIRATFQRAVAGEVGKHSTSLWTAYLIWEIDVAQGGGSGPQFHLEGPRRYERAKQVWHSGITALPWVKRFVILGIKRLGAVLTFEECSGFVRLMTDRGLRVHCYPNDPGRSSE